MNIWYLLYLPFEGIGRLLRMLSLHSGAGNILALCVYVCLSLLPVGAEIFWVKRTGKRFGIVEFLPILLSIYSFYLLYAFINPYMFETGRFQGGGMDKMALSVIKSMWASLWYMLFISYPVLCLVQNLRETTILSQKEYLYRGLERLLLCAVVVYGLLAACNAGISLSLSFQSLEANAGASSVDWWFSGLHILLVLIPQAWFLYVLLKGRLLLRALWQDAYAPETVEAAKALSRAAVDLVWLSVLSILSWNGALFLCRGMLVNTNYTLEFPLMQLLLAFAALILARYFKEAGELYQEHEMII